MNINNHILVNPELIQDAIKDGLINELSFYYLLKLNFKHSHISNRDKPKQRISKLTGLSINTISKHLHTLHYLGYIQPVYNGWNINTFKGNSWERKYNRITVSEHPTLNEIKDQLYLKILERKGNKQSKFDALEKYIDNKQAKGLSGSCNPNTPSYKPFLSIRYVSRLLNVSISTAFALMHRLMDSKQLKQHFEGAGFVCVGGDPGYLEDMYNYKYFQNSAIYHIEPARYEFLVNPIIQKPMTLREYKRLRNYPAISNFINYRNLLNLGLTT